MELADCIPRDLLDLPAAMFLHCLSSSSTTTASSSSQVFRIQDKYADDKGDDLISLNNHLFLAGVSPMSFASSSVSITSVRVCVCMCMCVCV